MNYIRFCFFKPYIIILDTKAKSKSILVDELAHFFVISFAAT